MLSVLTIGEEEECFCDLEAEEADGTDFVVVFKPLSINCGETEVFAAFEEEDEEEDREEEVVVPVDANDAFACLSGNKEEEEDLSPGLVDERSRLALLIFAPVTICCSIFSSIIF